MINRYRTYANDDLSIQTWVNYDDERRVYIVNSVSPQHNPCQYGTSYHEAHKAIAHAKDHFDQMTGGVEADSRECMGCHRIMSVAEHEHSRLCGNCTR